MLLSTNSNVLLSTSVKHRSYFIQHFVYHVGLHHTFPSFRCSNRHFCHYCYGRKSIRWWPLVGYVSHWGTIIGLNLEWPRTRGHRQLRFFVRRFRRDRYCFRTGCWGLGVGSVLSPRGEQPLGKVRARDDGTSCDANSDPLPFRETVENLWRKLGTGSNDDDSSSPLLEEVVPLTPLLEKSGNSNCIRGFQYHLCCTHRGSFAEVYYGRTMYTQMYGCDIGTSSAQSLLGLVFANDRSESFFLYFF